MVDNVSRKVEGTHDLWGVYTIQQTSSKLPANVFKIHVLMLNDCWTFAGSCKHPITPLWQVACLATVCAVIINMHWLTIDRCGTVAAIAERTR